MYTLIILSTTGYSVEKNSEYVEAAARFQNAIDRATTTCAAFYKEGGQINAYANPKQFKR